MNRIKSLWLTALVYFVTLLVGALLGIYLYRANTSLITTLIIIDVVMTVIVFIVSIVINNSSMYDPYWSIIPPFIVGFTMIWLSTYSVYSYIVLFGVSVWALRLTLNWYIDFKGFNDEDFRYVDFRLKFKRSYWLISFLGIHLFPTMIVLVGLYPILVILVQPVIYQQFIYLGVFVMVMGAIISFYADKQLRAHKQKGNKTSIVTGLWKHSRHPNYFGEVFFWFGVYLLGFAAGAYVETSIGLIGMLLLFNLYSVPKMEQKLLLNKSDYEYVVANIPRFFLRPNNIIIEENELVEVSEN